MGKPFERFTEVDKKFIRENLNLTNKQIGLALGRSESSISWQIAQMKIKRDLGKKIWSETEIEELKQIAQGKSRIEIAAHFNLPVNVVVAAMKNRGITNGRDTKLKTGNIPFYKGKKIPVEFLSEAMRKTWFPKGNVPHNTMNDGDIITKNPCKGNPIPYKWIRLSVNDWQQLHRYNYEKFIGPIPDGMLVGFKDRDTLNCEPSNLFLETAQQHMERNTIARFSPELRSTILLVAKVKRKIKNYAKQD
jgi:DNA-binding CsgD family transcriptional regulator